MLRVTIELLPKGDSTKARRMGTIEIANVGGSETVGNYLVRLLTFEGKRAWKTGQVIGFPRKQLGPYDLLLRALHGLLVTRNPEVAAAGNVTFSTEDSNLPTEDL